MTTPDWREVLANRNAEPQKPTVGAIKHEHPIWTASRIKALRHSLGMSAAEFGEALGFTGKHCKVTIHRFECRMRRPSEQTVILFQQLEDGLSTGS